MSVTPPPTPYRAGFGRAVIEGWAPGLGMLGWGEPGNVTEATDEPLMCRAMALLHEPTGHQLVYALAELCFVSKSLRSAVAARLAETHGLADHQLMLTATHNHSGPGGFNDALWYDVLSGGSSPELFDSLVETLVQAATQALDARQPAHLYLRDGPLPSTEDFSINRAPEAYQRNPEVDTPATEASLPTHDTMTVLRVDTADGAPLGLISWLGLHGTCVHGDRRGVRFDHKGAAARQLELERPEDFVAIFAQGPAGDQSPNTRWSPRRRRRIGAHDDDLDHRAAIADLQVRTADQIATDCRTDDALTGPLQTALEEVDFGQVDVTPEYTATGKPYRTEGPHVGLAFTLGTAEGPGPLRPIRHLHQLAVRVVRRLRGPDAHPRRFRFVEILDDDVQFFRFARMRHRWFPGWLFPDIYGLRSRFLAGEVTIDEMLPRHLPVQVIRLDRLALVGIAGEPTRVAGLRVQHSVGQTLERLGVRQVVVNGYANAYSGYVVTEHEYQGQGYEAGATLFGPHTLAAWQTALDRVAAQLPSPTAG